MTIRLTAGEVDAAGTVNGGVAPDGPEYHNGIFYPSSDGEPLAENDFQAIVMSYLFGALRNWFRNRTDIYVVMDMLIYYVEGDPNRSVAPDIAVMVGADGNHPRYSWMVWRENGVLPGLIIEVASPNTWRADAGDKRDLYARLGVGEYWRQDPVGGIHHPALIGERLVDGVYEPIEVYTDESGMLRGRSEVLGLDMCVRPDGEFRLYDPVGDEWLSSHDEALEGRREAEARAETAEARLEDLESENRRLRGLLREAGRGDHPHPSPLPEGEGIK